MRLSRLALLVAYLLLLAISYMLVPEDQTLRPLANGQRMEQIEDPSDPPNLLTVAYTDTHPREADRPVLLVLHDLPVPQESMRVLIQQLREAGRYRIVVPDLPGFGASSPPSGPRTIESRGRQIEAWLDALDIPSAHIAAQGHGALPALWLAAHSPERVRALVIAEPVAIQELYLLRDHDLNHAVHLAQQSTMWLLENGVPHFGWAGRIPWNEEWAKTLYATDLRPVREWVADIHQPVLLIATRPERTPPPNASTELERLIPQSRQGTRIDPAAESLTFLNQVERGVGARRSAASPTRLSDSTEPWKSVPLHGRSLLMILLLIVVAMQTSEDLTHIGAGLLVAKGVVGFLPVVGACVVGLIVGDVGLYAIGRWFGAEALRRPPLSWWFDEDRVERFEKRFHRFGPRLVFTCRFVPGSRVPVYIAAGMLRMPIWRFTAWLTLAALVWSPLLAGVAVGFGETFLGWYHHHHDAAVWGLVGVVVLLYLLVHHLPALFTHVGRRRLKARWVRWRRWEYWPPWLFYPPILLHIIRLAIRHRSLTVVTAVNPGISTGGLVLETKSEIFHGLGDDCAEVARWILIPPHRTLAYRVDRVDQFTQDHDGYPLILKPDIGQRGAGVKKIGDRTEVEAYLKRVKGAVIAQVYVPGEEYGVFYTRMPGEAHGQIISCTRKTLPELTADGVRTLERLIVDDDATLGMCEQTLERFYDQLDQIYPAGTRILLAPVGAHARGSVFYNAADCITPALAAKLDEVVQHFEGFHFGRFDLRVPDAAALSRGEGLRILELNGLTSESVHIYAPGTPLQEARRVLRAQWALAFRIAAANRDQGARPTPLRVMLGRIIRFLSLPAVVVEEDARHLIKEPPLPATESSP